MSVASIGEMIREVRTRKGMTQLDLAQALGYTDRSTISRIEADGRSVPADRIDEIARILAVPSVYLMNSLERNLEALDIDITYKEQFVRVHDTDTGITVSFTRDEWEDIRMKNDARKVHQRLKKQEADKALRDDECEILEYLDMLRSRPECRELFSLVKKSTKHDVEEMMVVLDAITKYHANARNTF